MGQVFEMVIKNIKFHLIIFLLLCFIDLQSAMCEEFSYQKMYLINKKQHQLNAETFFFSPFKKNFFLIFNSI